MPDTSKRAAVIVGDQVRDVSIAPGTTAGDVLQHLGLRPGDFWISGKSGEPLGTEETLFDKVPDGGKLYASSQAKVAG